MQTSPLTPVSDAMRILNAGRTGFYASVHREQLPPIVKRGRSSYVPTDELEAVLNAVKNGASEAQVRNLVRSLVQKRAERLPKVLSGEA